MFAAASTIASTIDKTIARKVSCGAIVSFVLTRLLEPLATRLERRDRAAAVLHVALGLTTREVHTCRLELPTPLRDGNPWGIPRRVDGVLEVS